MSTLKTINRTYIATCFFFLMLAAFSVYLSITMQIMLFLIGSLIVGLPHGAMDYDVAKFLKICISTREKIMFFTAYIFIAALNFLLWVFFPVAGLLFFIGLTIWHFGEDWNLQYDFHKGPRFFKKLCFGAAFICLPAVMHSEELIYIFTFITSGAHIDSLVYAMRFLAYPLIATIFGFAIFDVVHKNFEQSFLALAFVLSGLFLPPILFLLLYFCFLHGPRHTLELYEILKYRSFTAMLKSQTLVMILTAFILVGVFLFYAQDLDVDQAIFSSLIIVIACLTTPHMLLIEYMKAKLTFLQTI